ncbi:MAG: hypothetical protein NTW21_01530 [Verrucomicrobia bacterium]|nr:hypothetical protein [Verrucomicrobiota bacterium]
MKRLLALVLAGVAGSAAAPPPFTYQTPKWQYSTGNFNNDGQADLVLLERAGGALLVGVQIGATGFGWAPPEASGFTAPTGLCVGGFDNTATDQIAVTGPTENRVSIFTVNYPSLTLGIRHLDPGEPAPAGIAPVDGDGTGAADLFIAGDAGGGGVNFYQEVLVQTDLAPVTLWRQPAWTATYHVWPFVRKLGTPAALAAYQDPEFTVQAVAADGFSSFSPLGGVPSTPDSQMTYGFFDGGTLAQIILYQPGGTTALAAKVTEPTPDFFDWAPSLTLTFPRGVQVIVTIPTATGSRLGVIFVNGTAAIYDFNGSTLTLRADLTGTGFDFLAPVGNDAILTAVGAGWEKWDTSAAGGPLHPVATGTLPLPSSASRVSNIVFASAEPFVDPAAQAVFFGHVRDWTTAAVGGGSLWSVTSLTQDAAGLGNPVTSAYQPVPGALKALVNQYRADVSIRTMDPAAGPDPGTVIISPEAGIYPPLRPYVPPVPPAPEDPGDKFILSFTCTKEHGQVFYRLAAADPWQSYNPALPPILTAAATVEAFAQHDSGRTPTRSASYVFASPDPLAVAGNLDSNGNGLPDQWENAFNITDPGGDADGDGASNLTEFINHTDPRDPASGAAVPLALAFRTIDDGAGRALRLEWSPATSTAILEASDDLQVWTPVVSGMGSDSSGRFYDVPLHPPAIPSKFFRLRQP